MCLDAHCFRSELTSPAFVFARIHTFMCLKAYRRAQLLPSCPQRTCARQRRAAPASYARAPGPAAAHMADTALPSAALASARAALAAVPSLRLALALFALFLLLELLQRWAVLRPVRRHASVAAVARATRALTRCFPLHAHAG